MKYRYHILGVLCCITLFAVSFKCYAMDFDAEQIYQSVFVVYSGNSIGSGFAIGENAVVTNAHVIQNSNDIELFDYNGNSVSATVYLIDEDFDIAILSVNKELIPLVIGDSESINIGDDIYAIGAPKSLSYTLTKGVISNKKRQIGKYSYIQFDAAVNSGNSGGPLLNSTGEVIGINSMKMIDAEGIGLSIPISSVLSYMKGNDIEIIEDNSVNIKLPEGNAKTEENEDKKEVAKYRNNKSNIFWIVLLSCSVLLNIFFIVSKVYEKNKNDDRPINKNETTDFDIDILE